MAEQITIPISIFEVTVRYLKPAIRLLGERIEIIQALFDAFVEFNPNPDDMEAVSTGKTSEQGIKLKLASQRVNLFFGATHCKFTKEGAVWAEADQILSILTTYLTVLTNIAGIVPGKKKTSLSLHLQPNNIPFHDILQPFISSGIRNLEPFASQGMAVVVRWPEYRITIDGSAQLANGIFVQMERDFAVNASFDEMKQRVFDDEVSVLKLLNVEEVD